MTEGWKDHIGAVLEDCRQNIIKDGPAPVKQSHCDRTYLNIDVPSDMTTVMGRSMFMITIAHAARMIRLTFNDGAVLMYETIFKPTELRVVVTDITNELRQRRAHCKAVLLAMLAAFQSPLVHQFVRRIWEDTRENGDWWPPHEIGRKNTVSIQNVRFH